MNYIGSIEDAKDKVSLFFKRPHDRGYLINWDAQRQIWDFIFAVEKITPTEHELLLTEPYFNPSELQRHQIEVVYEEYGFQGLYSTSPSTLSMYNYQYIHPSDNPCTLVIDTGHSFSHIVPYFRGNKINYATKRVNIGGKILTNYLKEIVSYRHWNMLEETYLMTLIKERCCYLSLNFIKDLELTRTKPNPILCHYVLPDYVHHHSGYIKGSPSDPSVSQPAPPPTEPQETVKREEQILPMNNERITVPELLFHPSDIGVNQAGVAEAAAQAVQQLPQEVQKCLWQRVVLTGGNCRFPNFRERFATEVRKLVPSEFPVEVHLPEGPEDCITYAWHGGSKFASKPEWKKFVVSKKEYEEGGALRCQRKFIN